MTETYSLRAEVNTWPVVDHVGTPVDPESLPLSDRLVLALTDWSEFYTELDGDLSDPEVAEEFVGQGYKIAHALRRELKGRAIYLTQPVTGEQVKIG